MLGRKQSLRNEQILADYGPEEAFNESTDIEWVNKVMQSWHVLNIHFYVKANFVVITKQTSFPQ